MHSYEDRIRAVELYYRYGKKASVVVMELGYPSTKQLGRWVRIYEEGRLPRELKPRERYSRTQKIAAVEHYLTHGGCLSYTRRAIGYPSNEILKRWIEEFYPNARPWSFAQAQANASARKRGLRPSGSSVTDVEPRVKLHKA
jgi:transposase-like protein